MIDYATQLNKGQYAAATLGPGPSLVVAGAGTGKTRTIVYRLAWLLEHGESASDILLLSFTRKAAREMLARADRLLGGSAMGISGGTFHSFAYSVLRHYPPAWLDGGRFTVMDGADIADAIRQCKEALQLGKGDRSYPKSATIVSLLSKSRNKEMPIRDLLKGEAPGMRVYEADLEKLSARYQEWKREKHLFDYDDLLFELEALLMQEPNVAEALRLQYRWILVDEYQDTNLVQARIVRILSGVDCGTPGNVMVVGDEAQSIYSFRGAVVHNILDFPRIFPGTQIIPLEQNYRSTTPILGVANEILSHAEESYRKHLFTDRKGGEPVRVVHCMTDYSQATVVSDRISQLLETYAPSDIAVLFRAGYQSFHLEMALGQRGIRFRKYGGLKYTEAAHVKDLVAFLRLVVNGLDSSSFGRIAAFQAGLGPKTAAKLYSAIACGDDAVLKKYRTRFEEFFADMAFIDNMRSVRLDLQDIIQKTIDHYAPTMARLYPENYPQRRQALEEILSMADKYSDLDVFLAELMLEVPEGEDEDTDHVVLSTIHSAKGLEWKVVLIIDLVEDRFPSRHAMRGRESFEEERRLMYVACTRAQEILDLYTASSVYDRKSRGTIPASPSVFLDELDGALVEEYRETCGGKLRKIKNGCRAMMPARPLDDTAQPEAMDTSIGLGGQDMQSGSQEPEPVLPARRWGACGGTAPAQTYSSSDDGGKCVAAQDVLADIKAGKYAHCRHRIFGPGRVLGVEGTDKLRVEFPGYGVKTILASYLLVEE